MEAVKDLEGARLPVLTPNMKVCSTCWETFLALEELQLSSSDNYIGVI